ncbi:MAG: hypothetical protein QOI80_2724 [Solirubrobacteraceae bacterium]|nr:hypothetical protein [Solirubrobacteraceae bacterium]
MRAVLDAGRSLVSELDADAVLARLLETARKITGARYAAIGVLDTDRVELERFLVDGIDEDGRRAIGDLPHGRGVLGVLISDPRPLRMPDVNKHPLSYGFPPGHPPMHSFLGVPILMRGEPWGNLYLTDKPVDFTEDDEEAAVVLAEWAAVAIVNARLYRREQVRGAELERANQALETTAEVARALGGVTDVERVLELVVKRSRALVGARSAEIALLEGDEIVVAAVAGEGVGGLKGSRIPVAQSLTAHVLRTGRGQRFEKIPKDVFASTRIGAHRAIVTPMVFRSRTVGFLMVFDRVDDDDAPFTADDERLLEAFAGSAATAVATAQRASDEALRRSLAASEAERGRWARELHDETLQELAGLRVLLSGARRSEDTKRWRTAMDDAVELIGGAIHNLRALITDLRPASLDELGLQPALEALASRFGHRHGLAVELVADLSWESGRSDQRPSPELEAGIYRLVQEALTNIVKHADVGVARVSVLERAGWIAVEVQDQGEGFDEAAAELGFGLLGMRERVAMLDGTLEVDSRPGGGTTIAARIPLPRAPAEGDAPTGIEQVG